jgi:hypothetical protein
LLFIHWPFKGGKITAHRGPFDDMGARVVTSANEHIALQCESINHTLCIGRQRVGAIAAIARIGFALAAVGGGDADVNFPAIGFDLHGVSSLAARQELALGETLTFYNEVHDD